MFKRKPNSNLTVDTLIGRRTRINGDVEFEGGLHVDGTINGSVTCAASTDAFVSVSEHGLIAGSVLAPNVLLNGRVMGDIDATGRVELGAKANVLGNVAYAVIETAVGAQINGKLIHRESGKAPVQASDGHDEPPGTVPGDAGPKY